MTELPIQALCSGTKEILLVRSTIYTMNPPIPRPNDHWHRTMTKVVKNGFPNFNPLNLVAR